MTAFANVDGEFSEEENSQQDFDAREDLLRFREASRTIQAFLHYEREAGSAESTAEKLIAARRKALQALDHLFNDNIHMSDS